MLFEIIRLIVETVGGLFGAAMLLRAYMQWVRLGGRNPISEFVFALTNRVVLPLRRMIPARGGVDWASLLGAFFVAVVTILLLKLALVLMSASAGVPNPLTVALLAIAMMVRWALYTIMMLTVVYVILSWVNPYAPIAPALSVLVEPVLAPLQRILPRIGGIDLSPIALFLLVQIALLLLTSAERVIPGSL